MRVCEHDLLCFLWVSAHFCHSWFFVTLISHYGNSYVPCCYFEQHSSVTKFHLCQPTLHWLLSVLLYSMNRTHFLYKLLASADICHFFFVSLSGLLLFLLFCCASYSVFYLVFFSVSVLLCILFNFLLSLPVSLTFCNKLKGPPT